jgi:hypothetical protein
MYDGEFRCFDLDYNRVITLKRLLNQTPENRYLLLLNHESLELKLKKIYNGFVSIAHEKANEKYNLGKGNIRNVW